MYIDDIEEQICTKNRKTGEELTFLKFIVNNNDGVRVQCIIYNDDIDIFQSNIVLYNVSIRIGFVYKIIEYVYISIYFYFQRYR